MKQSKEKQKIIAKNNRLYKTYGITISDYIMILNAQGGVCACCGKLPGSGRLCVDHLHVLGFKKMSPDDKRKYVRGICCFMCNTSFKSIEKTKDGKRNREHLEGIIRYFSKYPLKGEI